MDNAEEGVVGYGKKLNIRPKYQRSTSTTPGAYRVDTIRKGFPERVLDAQRRRRYEMLDGRDGQLLPVRQQRFSIDNRAFHNPTKPEQDLILDSKLMIYCEGERKAGLV